MLLLRWGYAYGSGDQVEILPYAAKLLDESLYSKDLFVTQLASQAFNQRWGTAQLISLFGDHTKVGVYLLFVVCLYFLVTGLRRLWTEVLQTYHVHPLFEFIFVVTVLVVSQGWSPGGNDLYSESFIPDSIATTLVVWGLLFYTRSRFLIAAVLVGLATLFQPLLGFQVYAIMSLAGLILDRKIVMTVKQLVVYVISGGWLFALLLWAMLSSSGGVEMSDYFEVYFSFRAPHHFLPSAFLTFKSLGFLIVWITAIVGLYRQHKSLSVFLIIGLIGCVFYIVGVEVIEQSLVASTQWFKTTQWVKVLGILYLFVLIKPWLVKLSSKLPEWIGYVTSIGSIAGIAVLFMYPGSHPLNKRNDLVQSTEHTELYNYVRKHAEKDACFVVPLTNTDFKIGALRSVYVDFKSVDPKKSYVKEWKRRIELVYGSTEGYSGFAFRKPADQYYQNLSASDFELLAAKGVTHVVYESERIHPSLNEVFSSDFYFVYQIRK